MDIKKLLGLLFEHVESGDIYTFEVNQFDILIDDRTKIHIIKFNQDLLTQYNKIFGYES